MMRKYYNLLRENVVLDDIILTNNLCVKLHFSSVYIWGSFTVSESDITEIWRAIGYPLYYSEARNITNKNAFQSKAHLPLADRKSNTYNLTLGMTLTLV